MTKSSFIRRNATVRFCFHIALCWAGLSSLTPTLWVSSARAAQLSLAWDDLSNNEAGFKIERKVGPAGTYTEIATVTANVTSYTDLNLSTNTTYFYRVRAYNHAGDSGYSNQASGIPSEGGGGGSVPASPTTLTVTVLDSQRLSLSWVDRSNDELSFKIERRTLSGSFVQIATVAANVTSYTAAGLTPSTTYLYRVRASGLAGDSAYSNEASGTTATADGGSSVPASPTTLTATVLDSQRLKLNWQDKSNNELSFKIERRTLTGNFVQVATVGANVTSYTDAGLSPNTTYLYRVRASGVEGDSGYSNQASATTLPLAPVAPSQLTATAETGQRLKLKWKDNSNNETGFKIERALSASGPFSQIVTVGAGVISYTDSNLSPSTFYYYRVRAYNAGGNSIYSNGAVGRTDDGSGGGGAGGTFSATSESPTSATFVALDAATQGNWTGTYGTDGHNTIYDAINPPAYSQLAASDVVDTVWASSSEDPRALQKTSLQDRFAAGWTSESTFTLDLDLVDGQTHRVAFYCLDWEAAGNVQTAKVVDASTGALLDSQTLSDFQGGAYLIWDLNGRVQIQFTRNAGPGAALSGIFFDPIGEVIPGVPPPPPHSLGVAIADGGFPALSWADTSDSESGFSIERWTEGAEDFSQIATVGADVLSYIDTDVSPNTLYVYRVSALNTEGVSDPSNEASGTASNTSAQNVSFDGGGGSAVRGLISEGAAPTGNGLVGDSGYSNEASSTTSGDNANSVSVGEGAPPTDNGPLDTSQYSNEASTTVSSDSTSSIGAGEGSLGASASEGATPADNGFLAGSESANAASSTTSSDESANSVSPAEGAIGSSASEAAASSAIAEGSPELPSSLTSQVAPAGNEAHAVIIPPPAPPPPQPPPEAPQSLGVTLADGQFPHLYWTDTTTHQTGFLIERWTAAIGFFEQVAIVGSDVTDYTDTAVSPGTDYVYRVLAFNAWGTSGYSNEVTISLSTPEMPVAGDPPSGPVTEPGPTASGGPQDSSDGANLLTTENIGDFQFVRVDGEPGEAFLVQSSVDLVNWTNLQIVIITESGYSLFSPEPTADGRPTFYRALSLQ